MSEKDFKTLLKEHTKADEDRFKETMDALKALDDKLAPIIEYINAGKIAGKTLMKILGFVALCGGIILTIKKILLP